MDTISKIRVKGVDYHIEDENAGLEKVFTLQAVYDQPNWNKTLGGHVCWLEYLKFAWQDDLELAKELFDVLKNAKLVYFVNNHHCGGYEEREIKEILFADSMSDAWEQPRIYEGAELSGYEDYEAIRIPNDFALIHAWTFEGQERYALFISDEIYDKCVDTSSASNAFVLEFYAIKGEEYVSDY
jgi:hypothetical protein